MFSVVRVFTCFTCGMEHLTLWELEQHKIDHKKQHGEDDYEE